MVPISIAEERKMENIPNQEGQCWIDYLLTRITDLIKIQEYERALPIAEQALLMLPDNPDLIYLASTIYQNLNKFVKQLRLLERLRDIRPFDQDRRSALGRSLMFQGYYYSALSVVLSSPVQAHDQMQKAASCFRQAMVTDWSKTVDDYIAKVSSKSHCWMCGREMQGEDVFFKYYPAETEEYHSQLLESSNEDLRMIDNTGHVTVCTVCGSAIENQADRYATMRADEVRAWADQLFQQTNEVLMNHSERLRSLERVAHRH